MEAIDEIKPHIPQELSQNLQVITSYLTNKRWYELGESLNQFLKQPSLNGKRRIIFDKLIEKFSYYLEAFHYAHLVLLTSEEFADNDFEGKIEFLKRMSESKPFEQKIDPKNLILLRIVDIMTQKPDCEGALKLLNDIEKDVTEFTPIEVRSSFHRTQSNLDKARGDFDAFYQHALLYLSTSKVEKDIVLAYDLCMAALLSNKVCSFGELAAHKILSSLEGGEYQWLKELILLLDRGEPTTINEFNEKFLPIINQTAPFSNYLLTIQTKLALSVFLQVIFSRPFENRTLTFEEVSQACSININQVEILVLKALSAEIIKGTIDEVEQKIVVTWCKPKALGIDRLQHLKKQIDEWIAIVHRQRNELETKAQSFVG